jgi:4-hydroxy-4-methyl-2-oxoglutarate aldolase
MDIQHLSHVATGTICDAMARMQCTPQILDIQIRPIHPDFKITAPAFTVKTLGGSNAYIHEALHRAPPGVVMMIDVGGCLGSGHVGGLMSNMCVQKGIKGIIIDGSCRDLDEILALKFPVFARGANPKTNQRLFEGEINQVIQCGGVRIHPGDIVCADVSGVVVIPQSMLAEVLKNIKAVEAFEKEAMKKIKDGVPTVEIFGLKGHFTD